VRAVEVVFVDAFTAMPFTGNPAAVVPDATGLDEAAMRAVAAEMARPATAFLQPAAAGGERGLRWFSPAGVELTLCGHGTVAAAHVLATRGEAPGGQLILQSPRAIASRSRSRDRPHHGPRGSSRTARAGRRSAAISRHGSRSSGCPRAPSPGGRRPRGRRSRTC
jgi:predicted PhzF superfamily epimerase YddE/YHI9